MNFFRLKTVQNEKGSALLVAILLMTFVIVFGLGISSLIIDSIRVERSVVEAGKAYFAAEAGVERALYYEENYLPGYEVVDEMDVLENDAELLYSLLALSDTQVPCEHRDEEWRMLGVQESISLPLFYWDEDNSDRYDLPFFNLEFYVDRMGEDPLVNGNALRWKILGLDNSGNHTEATSGVLTYMDQGLGYQSFNSEMEMASFYDLNGPPFVNYEDYPVGTFLEHHFLNYLVLSNVVNPADQPLGAQSAEVNGVKLRLLVDDASLNYDENVACEYAAILSDGFSGDTKQSIDVQIRLDTFLPVFDFVLYQTDTSL